MDEITLTGGFRWLFLNLLVAENSNVLTARCNYTLLIRFPFSFR